jgi:hypothetical protein
VTGVQVRIVARIITISHSLSTSRVRLAYRPLGKLYEDVLRNFNRLIPHVLTGVTFIPAYGMTDCEPAER